MRQASMIAMVLAVAAALSGCGGSSTGTSRLADTSEPMRILPPSVTFVYSGTASVNEGGTNRTVPAESTITIGRPGFIDPRTNTPVLLYTQTFSVETVETLVYRDFFFAQPGGAVVAHGSEVFGVATFSFTPETLLPAQLTAGTVFGEQSEPYQTLTVKLRNSRVIRADRITVAGSIVDTSQVFARREIPFGRGFSRFFDETSWYSPEIAGPVPMRQRITYVTEGKAVTLELDIVGIPVLP